MGTPLIEIKNLSAGYDSRTVLRNVNLTVYDRDFLGIIGPNGGGKTTLIKCILGLLKPTGGEILYRGGRALKMGYLPQYNSIDRKFPITVEEVILSGLSSQKSLISRFTAAHREKARQVIARMGLAEINHDCAIILVSHDIGTVLQQVKSIACVNETLDYHPDTGISEEWLERNFNCPIELLGHGALPHRILAEHKHGDEYGCCNCEH